MDIFGRKRIAELEKALEDQDLAMVVQLKDAITKAALLQRSEQALTVKIREMDQLIFSMSQCTSWEEMRPIFAKLQAMAGARMIDESDRIKQVLIPEMQKAYREECIDAANRNQF